MKFILDRILIKPFFKIRIYGSGWCVDRIENIPTYFIDSQITEKDVKYYEIRICWMTEHQYRNLPEFMGF